MDLHAEADEYIRGSIESSLGLPVAAKTLQLKILASENERRRLQDQIFALQDRLLESDRQLDRSKTEASMNAQGLKRCIEEREMLASRYSDLVNHSAKLEKECTLYERDLERIMESLDELGRENEELRARLQEKPYITTLVAEVESLKKDKEHLRINLSRAEEEVKLLFDENKILNGENKKLLSQLSREKHHHHHGSNSKHSVSASSSKGKRKSSLKDGSPVGRTIEFDGEDSTRTPLSALPQNSPDYRVHKK